MEVKQRTKQMLKHHTSRVGDKILGIEKVELKPDNLRNVLKGGG